MLLAVLIHLSLGVFLAVGMMLIPALRSDLEHVAQRQRLSNNYALTLWFAGTAVAWPIGLVVFFTGHLVFANE